MDPSVPDGGRDPATFRSWVSPPPDRNQTLALSPLDSRQRGAHLFLPWAKNVPAVGKNGNRRVAQEECDRPPVGIQ